MASGLEQDDLLLDVELRRLRFCGELLTERKIIARYLKKCDWSHAGWIMLLELYVADKQLSVSSLGYASGVSLPTATRLTINLEAQDFVARERDPLDGRRTNVTLAPRGRATMRCILDDCSKQRISKPVQAV